MGDGVSVETHQQHYRDCMKKPCRFRLELTSDVASREQIIDRLNAIVERLQTLHRGVTGGGLFWENWTCEAKE